MLPGKTVSAQEIFFLHADRAEASFPTTETLFSKSQWKPLAELLIKSELDGLKGKKLYDELITDWPLLAAGLLNLYARTTALTLKSGKSVWSYFRSVASFLQDRIYALVDDQLHADVLSSVVDKKILSADGSLHEFPIPGAFKMLKAHELQNARKSRKPSVNLRQKRSR